MIFLNIKSFQSDSVISFLENHLRNQRTFKSSRPDKCSCSRQKGSLLARGILFFRAKVELTCSADSRWCH